LRKDGQVRYRLKRRWPDGRTELVLSPLALLRRLAWLIPPRGVHTVRYHGVFASNAAIRCRLLPRWLPRPRSATPCCPRTVAEPVPSEPRDVAAPSSVEPINRPPQAVADPDDDGLPLALLGPALAAATLLPIRSRRLDWASLLRRVFRFDVLRCPRCQAPLTVLAAISEPPVVTRILQHLGLPSDAPLCQPARGPPRARSQLRHLSIVYADRAPRRCADPPNCAQPAPRSSC